MRKPIFIITKYQSKYYPYKFECKSRQYSVVYATIEDGMNAIEARFGKVIFRNKCEVK